VVSVTSYAGTGSPRFYLPLDQIFPQTNVSQIVVLPKDLKKDLKARSALRDKIVDVFKHDFPEVRGRVKLLPNGPPVPYPVHFRVTGGEVDKVRALGVTSQTVMRAANTILSGTTIGQFREGIKLIDIQVRQPIEERNTIAILNDTNIPTSDGKSVTISQLARAHLWREGRDWAITVQSDVADNIQGPTVSGQIEPQLKALRDALPAGYAITVKDAASDSGAAEASIAAKLPLAIFLIFTLLMLQLHSFSRSLLVFLTGPLGVAGAAMALLLLGRPLGFVANLGIIALFGMIIRN
jgi:multidrug efflux pump subunit AcrB